MQTPKLSNAQWAFMRNPEGFKRRMTERAEALWTDGYSVEAGDEVGLFLVTTPKGEEYRVNILTEGCTCAYQAKAELPEVPCKHLQGLEGLIAEQVAQLRGFAEQHDLGGHTDRAAVRWAEYHRLNDAWHTAVNEATNGEYLRLEANAECAAGCDPHARY